MDYYSILGVPKNASQEDIKSAYRKLAKEHHPDRTGGDSELFKKINEAYDVLKDPARRQEYDNPQPRFDSSFVNNGPGHFGMGGGFEDIFAQAFGGRARRQPRNEDIVLLADIKLQDVFTGKTVFASYNLNNGQTERVEVKIPAGINDGQQIRYKNLGDNSIRGIPRGDLYIKVKIQKDKNWSREGIDLHTQVSINIFDCILGTVIPVSTPEGKTINLKIPKGTNPGTVFSIGNYGIPDYKRGRRGTLFIKIKSTMPQITDEKMIKQLEKMRNATNNGP